MLEIFKTRIIKLKDKKLNKINEKIQKNESVTSKELNKLWDSFLKNDVKHSSNA